MTRRKKIDGAASELMPLIDMVFILLIFFMLSSQFLKPVITLNLPVAGSGTQLKDSKLLIVSLTKEKEIFLNQEQISNETLVTEIKKRLSSNTKVVISADKEVEYGAFVTIMDSLKKNGINDVSLEYEQ
jgi:biopolymer transport protein ExbD